MQKRFDIYVFQCRVLLELTETYQIQYSDFSTTRMSYWCIDKGITVPIHWHCSRWVLGQ